MFEGPGNFGNGLLDQFRRMEQEMDEMFGRWPWAGGIRSVARGTYPPLNVGATAQKVDVYVFAAGIDPNSLEVSLQQNVLSIAGEREVQLCEGASYYRQERFSGAFRRVVALPEDVDPDRVEARYSDGVVHITVHRREASQPRQIKVSG